jgi:hypothetical protein
MLSFASEVTNIIAQAPPVLEAMTGIKLTELMKSVPGLSQPPIEVQPVWNGATPAVVPAITPESLVAVVDSPVVKPDEK